MKSWKLNYNNYYIFVICFIIVKTILGASCITTPLGISFKFWNYFAYFLIYSQCLWFVFISIRKSFTIKKLFFYVALIVLTIAINHNVNDINFLASFIAIIAISNRLNFDKLSKCVFLSEAVTITMINLLALFGIVDNVTSFQRSVTRQAMGFSTANAYANIAMFCIIVYAYYKRNAWKRRHSFLLIGVAFILYRITYSRMAFTAILAIAVFYLLFINNRIINRLVANLSVVAFGLFSTVNVGVVIYFAKFQKTALYTIVDTFLTSRLSFCVSYYNKYGIKPFGQILEFVNAINSRNSGVKWSGIDNSYVYILLRYGWVLLVALVIMYGYFAYISRREQDIVSSFLILIICVIGISENVAFNVAFNFTLLIMAFKISNNLQVLRNSFQ